MLYPEETVQSQYAASHTIRELVDGFNRLIDPRQDIQLFYDKIFNPNTAEGIGLRIWARIVGLKQTGLTVTAEEPFGFYNQMLANFNNGPFFSEALSGSGYAELEANALRWLVFYKAQANNSGASLYEMNNALRSFVEFMEGEAALDGTYIEENGNMALIVHLGFTPNEFEQNILTQFGFFNRGGGVSVEFDYPQ